MEPSTSQACINQSQSHNIFNYSFIKLMNPKPKNHKQQY